MRSGQQVIPRGEGIRSCGRGAGLAAAHLASVIEVARQSTVLLKNDGFLPIPPDVKSIAVIGGFAHLGMVSGGGFALSIPLGGTNRLAGMRRLAITGPAPVVELGKQFPKAEIMTDAGESPVDSAAVARRADIAVVFAWKTESEGHDHGDLNLPWGQGQVLEAVIAANPNTVVVLQTGNPVEMPWKDKAPAIMQASYFGSVGGRHCGNTLRQSESFRPLADHLLCRCRSDAAPGPARLWHADEHTHCDSLSRRRRGGLPLVGTHWRQTELRFRPRRSP